MPEPISFPTETNSFSLPLLFAGQAQKEFFVNQAFVIIDSLLGQSVVASLASPPAGPTEGEVYRIVAGAAAEWSGHDDKLAIWVGETWQFFEPLDGMRVFDRTDAHLLIYRNGWIDAPSATEPEAGSVIDVEARAAIAELSQTLRDFGLLQASP